MGVLDIMLIRVRSPSAEYLNFGFRDSNFGGPCCRASTKAMTIPRALAEAGCDSEVL